LSRRIEISALDATANVEKQIIDDPQLISQPDEHLANVGSHLFPKLLEVSGPDDY